MSAENIVHFFIKGYFSLLYGFLLGVDSLTEDSIEVDQFNLVGFVVFQLRGKFLDDGLVFE